jgi:raffinose/stachyose/melibiose transport system substrate-binding protein
MKRKKLLALVMAGAMVFGLAACGSSSSNGDSASSDSEGIRLLNGKPEIDDQLQELAAKYEEETGNKVTIETIGGDTSASDELKKMYQADNMPDIFVIEANQAETWDGMLADLSDEDWVSDTSYELTQDDTVIGFPYTVEATGLAYNADILEAAGIDPSTLTTPAAYEEAFATLDSKKDELGLTAVVGWCTEPNNLGWSSGTHVFAQYLDAGLAQDDTKYLDLLNDGGQIDEDRMTDFAEFVGMLNNYSDPDLLVDGTYDDQVANFAAGKYAFVTQGSWIGATVTSSDDYSGFKMGIAPYAFEDGIDTIIGGAPSFWTVYNDGQVDAAKEFLQWVSEDSAQQILVEEANLISPFDSCAYAPTDPFFDSIKTYMDADKLSGWHTMLKKDGLQNVTCVVFNDYAKGTLDTEGFVSTMEKVIKDYYAE